jgi:hypothetical protein
MDSRSYAYPPKKRAASRSAHWLGHVNIISFEGTSCSPASLFMPSLPATTQELLHSPHTNLSFPSLVHPHFEAATASIAGGLFAYVASLNVDSRDRNAGVEEGR